MTDETEDKDTAPPTIEQLAARVARLEAFCFSRRSISGATITYYQEDGKEITFQIPTPKD